jgi:ATP adenylyltransferase
MREKMKHLWAPWRMVYIKGAPKASGCLFCKTARARNDKGNLLLHRGRLCFVMMNRYPYNTGHLMIAPYRHVAALEDLTDKESADLLHLAGKCLRVLGRAMKPQGFNLGMNLGRVAGAGVLGHLHLHIVPRWSGDTNFMPVIGGTKVVAEALTDTYEMLLKGFAEK